MDKIAPKTSVNAPVAVTAPTETPAAARTNTIVFTIPMGPLTLKAPGAASTGSTKSHAVLTGAQLEVASSNANTPPVPLEAIEVLRNAFAKKDGDYVVSPDQLSAAKRSLLRFWGFPEAFVKEYGAEMQLNQLGHSDSVVRADGFLSGTLGSSPFTGSVFTNDDWPKGDIEHVMQGVLPPAAATSLSCTEDFFERNGVSAEDRATVTDRLFAALSNWKTIGDEELAWAKGVIATGYELPTPFSLGSDNANDSALRNDQSITGTCPEDGKQRVFQLWLNSGTRLTGATGWHIETGTLDGNLPAIAV